MIHQIIKKNIHETVIQTDTAQSETFGTDDATFK